MEILAGKFGFKAQFQLQCRASLVPWVEKKSAITCLKKRENSSSSVPVRYNPKKSAQTEKFENSGSKRNNLIEYSQPSPSLNNEVSCGESLVQEGFDFNVKPRKQSEMLSSNGLIDDQVGKYSTGEFEEDDIMEEDDNLSIGQRINNGMKFATSLNFDMKTRYQSHDEVLHDVVQDDDLEEPFEIFEDYDDGLSEERIKVDQHSEFKTKLDAEKMAVRLLASRGFTAVELEKKLIGKKFPPNIVESVISEFQHRGLLNDGLFAEAYCKSRWTSSTWGPRKIKLELSRKGVNKVDSNKAVQLVFSDGDHQELRHGLSKTSLDHLFAQASKQWVKGRDLPNETRKARVIRWLQYRGFTWDVVVLVVKKLESNH